MLGIGDVAVAGQLVALVAVLPAALSVALAGDRRDAASRLAELAGGETEVDRREHVVDALRVVLDAPSVEQHAGRGRAPPLGRLLDPRRGDARDARRPRGVISATAAAASSKPEVCASMKSWSSQSSRISTCSMAPNSAESVPGRTPRNRSAVRASGTTRGSWTISLAPRSRACQMQLVVIGNVSATFDPATQTTSARGMSLHGFDPRSMPRAFLLPAPAETMQ